MVLKVKIKCIRCDCDFELSEKFSDRQTLKCPNCGQEYPENHFRSLKEGIKLLGSVPCRCGAENRSGFYSEIGNTQL